MLELSQFGRLIGAAVCICGSIAAQSRLVDCGSPADAFYFGGLSYSIPGATAPPDPTLRFGSAFSYHIPASGDVTVKLTFVEPNQTTPGARIFSVSINDAPVIQNLDLVATAGTLTPYTRKFPASARNGLIDIVFTTQVRSAVVSAIEILGSPLPPVPVGVIDGETPAGTIDGTNLIFTLSAPPVPASSLHLYLNGLRQKSGFDFRLSGNTITFLPLAAPQPGSTMLADYSR